MTQHVESSPGYVDVLINNAGVIGWDAIMDREVDCFREVMAVKLFGHAHMSTCAELVVAEMGDDILAVADVCNLERFLLCGYSFGGNVSRYLAARLPRISTILS